MPPLAPTVLDAAFAQDPYPVLRRLREHGPVHPVLLPHGVPAWLVVSYEAAREALADPRLVMRPPGTTAALPPHPLNLDPPDHTRLRRLLAPSFGRDHLATLRAPLARLADRLLDGLLAGGPVELDLMGTFAQHFPTAALHVLLGVPDEGHELVGRLVAVTTSPTASAVDRAAAEQELLAHAAALAARTDLVPGSLLDRLRTAGELTPAELVATVNLLLMVGDETIVHVLGNGLVALLADPDLLARLRADPAGLPDAIEEMLRYDGPVNAATFRWAAEPVPIGDTIVPAGSAVLVSLTGAGRDPDRYPEPDRFRPERDNTGGIGFGRGPHYCVGAGLARLELEIAFGALLARTAEISLTVPAGALRHRPVPLLRGLDRLPVRLVPA